MKSFDGGENLQGVEGQTNGKRKDGGMLTGKGEMVKC